MLFSNAYASNQRITILIDTNLYNSASVSQPAGRLSANQTLEIKEIDNSTNGIWYRVGTWLGDKWIQSSSSEAYGWLKEMNSTRTTLRAEYLEDYPNPSVTTWEKQISPQKVKVTGAIESCFVNNMGVSTCHIDWYRINTWLGEKWLYFPKFKEDIKEQTVDFDLLLTDKEDLYTLPYEASGEQIPAGKVKVVAQWKIENEVTSRNQEVIWYKIESQDGFKWLQPKNPTKTDTTKIDQIIDLPTVAKGYDSPVVSQKSIWIEPGKVNAFEKTGDWYHVKIANETKWVNPSRALLERPIGTVTTDKTIRISSKSATYSSPVYPTLNVIHPSGYFSEQDVRAFATWKSTSGEVWYLIHGFDGDAWVGPY